MTEIAKLNPQDNFAQEVGEELIVYHSRSQTATLLSAEARLVYELINRETDPRQIAVEISKRHPHLQGREQEVVEELLSYLQEPQSPSVSRRSVLKVAGLVLASSVVLPRPASAASVAGVAPNSFAGMVSPLNVTVV